MSVDATEGYGLEAGQMKGYWDWYLRKDKDGRNPLASPLRAKKWLLKGLPPVLLMRAEHEILWDEISEMGRNLAEAGQEVGTLLGTGGCAFFFCWLSLAAGWVCSCSLLRCVATPPVCA